MVYMITMKEPASKALIPGTHASICANLLGGFALFIILDQLFYRMKNGLLIMALAALR